MLSNYLKIIVKQRSERKKEKKSDSKLASQYLNYVSLIWDVLIRSILGQSATAHTKADRVQI